MEKVTLACLASFSCFWHYKCPCNFPLDESVAFKLHTLIYFDFIFKLSNLILLTNDSSGSQKLTAAIFALGL